MSKAFSINYKNNKCLFFKYNVTDYWGKARRLCGVLV